jgi:hypothetical protein
MLHITKINDISTSSHNFQIDQSLQERAGITILVIQAPIRNLHLTQSIHTPPHSNPLIYDESDFDRDPTFQNNPITYPNQTHGDYPWLSNIPA